MQRRAPRIALVLASVTSIGVASCAGAATTGSGVRTDARVEVLRRPIRFDRAYRVGERSRVETSGSRTTRRSIEVEGMQPRAEEQTFIARFEAHARVVAVNASSFPTQLHYEIIHFESERDGQSFETLPFGAQVDLTRGSNGSESVITVDGHPASAQQQEALALVLTLDTNEGRPNVTAIFGSESSRSPGDSWSVTDRPAAREMAGFFHIVDGFAARTTYHGAVTLRGIRCLDVTTAFEGALAPPEGMPAGLTVRHASVRSEVRERVPLDATVPALQVQLELVTDVEASGVSEGHEVRLRLERRSQLNAVAVPDNGA